MAKNNSKYTKFGLEEKITSIETKIESIDGRLDSIDKHLERNTASLIEHMKRSDNLEEIVNKIQETELKPLHRHVTMVEGVMKFIGALAIFVGLLSGLANLFGMI